MAIPVIPVLHSPSKEEVDLEGQLLLKGFVSDRLAEAGVGDPNVFSISEVNVSDIQSASQPEAIPLTRLIPSGYYDSSLSSKGAKLKEWAEEFGKSPQRVKVNQEANETNLDDLNRENCQTFLSDYFKDSPDKWCLLSLFYYCSDVLLRCIKEGKNTLAKQFFLWCLEFMVQKVCKWVYEHGGWEKVFGIIWNTTTLVALMVLTGLGIVGIGCGIVYIRKHW
ncbi:apoptosis regulator BAX-like [Stegodyphus dumicola]|uniref:apoptosis regulator BAX-like n=1 Tax=Stegodyphus dumicola TaxID=202533 RepID=UPI0015AEB2E1|nr:apoptosis regulator BAX-like [Stegodyphus dumicola]XP_035232981.1 apoptosis regulator BAX-like [Stegodyphus dumicola]